MSPVEVLLGHKKELVTADFYTWGCPVFVLDPDMQTSPQYHVVFDDKFSTIPYLQSSEAPPNWTNLVAKCTENATEQVFTIASSWYEGESVVRSDTATNEETTAPSNVREQGRPFIDINTAHGLRRSPQLQALREQSRA
eukprot:774594-Ditylum_brightwellii.AAC.2